LLELGRQAPFFRYDLSAFAEELPTEPPASDISTVGLRCANIVEEFKSQADERSVRRVGEELWSGLIERSREAWGERLVLSAVGIALVAGRIRPRRSEGTSALVRADEGLVARIRDARLRSGRRAGKWWRAQADAATTSDEKWLVATAASLWASGEALEGVLDFVSETMDGCELKAFALAAESFRHARFSGALRDPGLSMRAQRELSPRVAVLVIRRSSEQSGRAIYEQRLARYRGRDEAVLNHCAAMEIGANANWQKALALARRAYRYGVAVQFDDGFLGARATGMSLELARTVVERPRNYPFWVVNVAELTCRRYANGVAARVEKVARQERWFADQARTSR
jgi:hypothetical protein